MSHLKGRLYRLGRLQFAMGSFGVDFHAFRHRAAGRVFLLAGPNLAFRRDGQFNGVNGVTLHEGAWTSSLDVGPHTIRGHVVCPYGGISREPIQWPAADYAPCLAPGDPVLEVHIPATGPLIHEACGESFREAMDFFPRYFPEHRFRAFSSGSWMFDPQLERYLPAESNLVRFLREFYLHPIPGGSDQQTLERVLGVPIPPLARAPQASSLQRAVVRHMREGGQWHRVGALLLPEDLAWGKRVYRAMFDAAGHRHRSVLSFGGG